MKKLKLKKKIISQLTGNQLNNAKGGTMATIPECLESAGCTIATSDRVKCEKVPTINC